MEKLLSPDPWNFPNFPWHGFFKTANVMCNSEYKAHPIACYLPVVRNCK